MKKSILNLGKTLNKTEQKEIKGSYIAPPECNIICNSPCTWGRFATACGCPCNSPF